MVTVTAAAIPRQGDPVDNIDLGKEHLEIWKKATGGGSAIAFGTVVVMAPDTSTCAIAGVGAVGRFGVVVRLDDNFDSTTGRGFLNTDTSDKVYVGTNGGRYYVKAGGTIKLNSDVKSGAAGVIVQATGAITDPLILAGVYEGKYGQSLQAAGEYPTDAALNDTVILRTSGRSSS